MTWTYFLLRVLKKRQGFVSVKKTESSNSQCVTAAFIEQTLENLNVKLLNVRPTVQTCRLVTCANEGDTGKGEISERVSDVYSTTSFYNTGWY